MAFSIKHRMFAPSATQDTDPNTSTFFDTLEQISGPYDYISQEMEDGNIVVHAHREGGAPGMTFGPWKTPDVSVKGGSYPRPTLYVMNEHGATVAKYDL